MAGSPDLGASSFSGPVQQAERLPGGGARLQEAGPGPGLPGRTRRGLDILAFSDSASEADFSFGVDTACRVLTPLCGSDKNAISVLRRE